MPTCACQFPDRETERQARRQFLTDYGDDIPEFVIDEMVADPLWEKWVTACDCADPTQLLAVGHYKESDWYLCTVRGLAVKEDQRGKGLGREVTGRVIEKGQENPNCLVFGADVTFDNVPSQRSLARYDFEPVGEFCWAKGQKPADILHMVRFKPTKDKTCLGP